MLVRGVPKGDSNEALTRFPLQFLGRLLHPERAPALSPQSPSWRGRFRRRRWLIAASVRHFGAQRHGDDVSESPASHGTGTIWRRIWCRTGIHFGWRSRRWWRRWRRRWWRRRSWRRSSWIWIWRTAGHLAATAGGGQVAHVQLPSQLGSAHDALQALRVSSTAALKEKLLLVLRAFQDKIKDRLVHILKEIRGIPREIL